MTPMQAATVLGISAHAVRDLVRRKKLPAVTVEGRLYVDAAAVLARKDTIDGR